MDKEQEKQLESIKNGVLRKFPALGVTMSNLKFCPTNEIATAGTNGEQVLYSPSFVNQLTFDEKVFLFAHEIMHVAFNHILRSKDRNPGDWNIATDAVINQMLKKAKLPLPEGAIDIAKAHGKSAEEMYEILQKKQQNQNKQQNSQNQQTQNNQSQQPQNEQSEQQNQQSEQQNQQNEQLNEQSENNQNEQQIEENFDGQGKHNLWQKAVEKAENEQKNQSHSQNQIQSGNNQTPQHSSQTTSQKEQNNSRQPGSQMSSNDFEKMFSQMNEEMKEQIGERIRTALRQQKENAGNDNGRYTSSFENVGEAPSVLSWKKILRRELEKEEDRWSYRRADEENDYQARIGSLEVEDYPETECMLDVSGSVDDEFLKGFLRQLKPLLKQSKLRVGCFDEFVYPFVEIKTAKDIDHFRVTRESTWTENWDAAVRAFSKKRGVNKIIFTDGWPAPGVMPKDDLSKVNVIWLVFENKSFRPCCGKVIFVDRSKLDYLNAEKNNDFSM